MKVKARIFSFLNINQSKYNSQSGTLTIEAALVLPVFLYFMIFFISYIQVFTIQEQIQAAITKMGLNLAKSAYILKDFPSMEDTLNFDFTIFGEDYDLNLERLTDELASSYVLKLYARKYLDTEEINNSYIKKGFDGLSFMNSSLISSEDYTDIVVSYSIEIPLKIITLGDMELLQRVRLRNWTGHEVKAAYVTEEGDTDETTVYVTATGGVYHKTDSCSHIKLSITAVHGIPTDLRNDQGGKYYPCESCGNSPPASLNTFFITTDGTRYHTRRDCSRIKRSVKAIASTEIGDRSPCKRCYKVNRE